MPTQTPQTRHNLVRERAWKGALAQAPLLSGRDWVGQSRLRSIGDDHPIENLTAMDAMPTGKHSAQYEFEVVIERLLCHEPTTSETSHE